MDLFASSDTGGVRIAAFPAGPRFIEQCAGLIVDTCRSLLPDLSACTVVLPNLALAPPLRVALAAAAQQSLLLPRTRTLDSLAEDAPGLELHSQAQRRVDLYEHMERRGWFADGARWEICSELIALFDALTERAMRLPETPEQFLEQLERAYRLRACEPLRFEARVIHELWRAESAGQASPVAAQALGLARAASAAQGTLFLIGDGGPRPAADLFLSAWARRAPAYALVPTRTGPGADTLAQVLNAAWPIPDGECEPTSLAHRALSLREYTDVAPLAGRVRLLAAESLEEEATAVSLLVRRWLAAGKRSIALVAADREAARRARALLERHEILIQDETGWKLSTTRAAALMDAWLEVVASEAYHRDLLDLLKSPFLFADVGIEARRRAVLEIESCIASDNLICDLGSYDRALRTRGASDAARNLLHRAGKAREAMPTSRAPLAVWLDRARLSLARLGAMPMLEGDAAGRDLLALLHARSEELGGSTLRLDFAQWREWLNRELEEAMFRDRSVASPVVMTHLSAARLRAFDAAIIIGADAQHLAPTLSRGILANAAVRFELGLGTPSEEASRHENDLAFLIACCGEVVATWQAWRGAETQLIGPALGRLSLLHQLAFDDDLHVGVPRATAVQVCPQPASPPSPVVPAHRLPRRIPVTACADLISCPYRFFARHVLGMSAQEAVRETLEKRDYGTLVHACLRRFHERFPVLVGHADAELAAALEVITEQEFAPAVARNFLEAGWQTRWQGHIPAYIAWQRRREERGWRFAEGETTLRHQLTLGDGTSLELHGRVDRLDSLEADQGVAVMDYKTRSRKRLKDQLADGDSDVQLALYAGFIGPTALEAAYVAVDDETIDAVPLQGLQDQAARQRDRLVTVFDALRRGAGMPANGADQICAYCETRGLCRKGHWS